MVYSEWRDLEKGAYVQLACGCEGWIEEVIRHSADESDRGFMMVYTYMGCGNPRKAMQRAYRDGYGPYKNMFNYDLPEKAMPARDAIPPDWFPNLEHGPARGFDMSKAKYNLTCIQCGRTASLYVVQAWVPAHNIFITPNTLLGPNGYDSAVPGISNDDARTDEKVRCIGCGWVRDLIDVTIEKNRPLEPEISHRPIVKEIKS